MFIESNIWFNFNDDDDDDFNDVNRECVSESERLTTFFQFISRQTILTKSNFDKVVNVNVHQSFFVSIFFQIAN